MINSRPCLKFDLKNNSKYYYYSPLDIFLGFKPGDIEIKQQQYNEMINSFEIFEELLTNNQIVRNHILSNLKNALSLSSISYSKNYRRNTNLKPKINDLALMLSDGEHKICRIISLNKHENMAKVQIVKRGKTSFQNAHVSVLSLLYRFPNNQQCQ